MDKKGSEILEKLGKAVSGSKRTDCPSPEDLAVLIEDKAGKERKKELLDHIGSCDSCYETYSAMLDITDALEKKGLRLFTPLSIAATLFIALAAFVVFYQVNIGVKGPGDDEHRFSQTPVRIKEPVIEHRSVKKERGPAEEGERKKTDRRRIAKTVAAEKELKEEKSAELPAPEEPEPPVNEPAGTGPGVSLRNTQGIGQTGGDPPPEPASFSAGALKDESGKADIRRMKSRKGLVDKLKAEEEIAADKKETLNCFKREGDRFVRRREFVSEIPLSDVPPELEKVAQPENRKDSDPVTEPDYIVFEILTDRNGGVNKVCLVSGETGNIGPVLSAVKKWKFNIPGNAPIRFRLVLGISGNRIIEVLGKK